MTLGCARTRWLAPAGRHYGLPHQISEHAALLQVLMDTYDPGHERLRFLG